MALGRRTYQLLLALILLSVAVLGLHACWPASDANSCGTREDAVATSPDGRHGAILTHGFCDTGFGNGNDSYAVSLRSSGATAASDALVFFVWDYAPTVEWDNTGRLVITIQAPSRVRTTLHQEGGVPIAYRIADKLKEENFRRGLEDYKRRTEENLRNHVSTFTGDPVRDQEALKETISRQWDDYNKFQGWARANTENDDAIAP